MSDTYYEPRDAREIAGDRDHEDRHAAQDALEADGAYVPHNRGRWLTEAERQQIENAGIIERQNAEAMRALSDAAEKTGISLERLLDAWEAAAFPDDERYPSETERDWHPE